MKFISKLIPVLALSGVAVATQAAEGPNVIIVFIDDFGYGDLGCYGVRSIVLPISTRWLKREYD